MRATLAGFEISGTKIVAGMPSTCAT